MNAERHGCTQINIGGVDLWRCLTCGALVSSDTQAHVAFHATLAGRTPHAQDTTMLTHDGAVERCAECDGAFRVVGTSNDDVHAIRDAARQGRYLAERVTHINQVDKVEHGHRVACSRWKEA